MKIKLFSLAILTLLLGTSGCPVYGQVRAGSAFLKILPGTRQQSLASSLTGALDESYALYANPAATGFLREWQWSASYTKWIADIYNISLLYGRQLRFHTPWSDRTNIAFGLNYQGVKEFDSSRGAAPSASANDLLISFSLASPLTALTRNLALGINLKYVRSELAQFKDASLIFDVGAIYRTPRIALNRWGLGVFDYLILSGGFAVTQLGSAMNFVANDTPLPRTVRSGAALNLGKHDGLQIQVALDYRRVRDEESRFSIGTEITNLLSPLNRNLGRALAIRGGYTFSDNLNTDLVSKFSVGLSLRLDDYMYPRQKQWTPNNTALRFDLGTIESKFFPRVFQASTTYRPIKPERFGFAVDLTREANLRVCDPVDLAWEATRDPDLYDQVNYLLLVVKEDSARLASHVEQAKSNQVPPGWLSDYESPTSRGDSSQVRMLYLRPELWRSTRDKRTATIAATFDVRTDSTSFVAADSRTIHETFFPKEPGRYFWTVLAYDRNGHFRVVGKAGHHIARFRVQPDPDLTIKITRVRRQGSDYVADVVFSRTRVTKVDDSFSVQMLGFTEAQVDSIAFIPVKEPGEYAFNGVRFVDRSDTTKPLLIDWTRSPAGTLFKKIDLPGMAKMDSTVQVTWAKAYSYLVAVVDKEDRICESDETNNTYLDTLRLYDLELKKTAIVKPIRPNIFFDRVGSFELSRASKKELHRLSTNFNAPEFSSACVKIDGHTDEQGFASGNSFARNLELSRKRVTSVKKYLVDSLGVDSTRIAVQAFGQSRPIIRNVESSFAYLTRAQRDSLHRINRRVEIYLIRKKCPAGTAVDCTKANQVRCTADTVKAVNEGDSLRYVFTVTNLGPYAAQGVTVTDLLAGHLSPQHSSPAIDSNRSRARRLVWNLDSLPADSSTAIELTVMAVDSTLSDSLLTLVNLSALHAPYLRTGPVFARDTVYVLGGEPPPRPSLPDTARRQLQQPVFHQVRRGDYLAKIASHYSAALGYPITWCDVYALNKQLIGPNPDSLTIGRRLLIPGKAQTNPLVPCVYKRRK
ncbi:MAG: PorV/PorQ family protein [bacterium]